MLLLDRYIKVHRLADVGRNKSSYLTLTVSIDATIQPASDTKLANYGGSHSELFSIYCDVDRDIKEGDEVRDYDGNIYKIEAGGVKNRNDGFIADYMDLIVTGKHRNKY
jgi:hypothetical protein